MVERDVETRESKINHGRNERVFLEVYPREVNGVF